jgi:molybdopterin-guanine dinucleotide biosynthesis protein A
MNHQIYPDLAVAILAGGQSHRFGADKALVRLDPAGPTILERTAMVARSLSDAVAIFGHRRYEVLDLGVPIVPDSQPGEGPLQGIAAALEDFDRPRVLVLACDLPCLSPALLRSMIERPSSADVVIPVTDNGHWHALHAIYRRTVRTEIEAALAAGNRSVRSFLPRVAVDRITEEELRVIDPTLGSLLNLNTPADLDFAMSCASLTKVDTD